MIVTLAGVGTNVPALASFLYAQTSVEITYKCVGLTSWEITYKFVGSWKCSLTIQLTVLNTINNSNDNIPRTHVIQTNDNIDDDNVIIDDNNINDNTIDIAVIDTAVVRCHRRGHRKARAFGIKCCFDTL